MMAPESAVHVWNLLKLIVEGYRHLCSYRCKEALEALGSLPTEQYNTAWVLCQVGKAKCELVEYHDACRVFKRARTLAPWHLEGMEEHLGSALVS